MLTKFIIFFKGFRNCVNYIKDNFDFDVKIPYCRQLNKDSSEDKLKKQTKVEQPLTPSQAADSRLVTKVRFQIEFVNSMVKVKQALDYVRNDRLGYLFLEYRIMCSMINFTFKPVLTDKPVTLKVAKMMRQKYEEPQFNDLEFLLGKQLGTNTFQQVEIETIEDFPQLKRRQMKRFIFHGTFHLKRAKSYLIDIVRQSNAFIMDKKQLIKIVDNLPDNSCFSRVKSYIYDTKAKIIATKVSSRHKRALDKTVDTKVLKSSYKVLICYFEQTAPIDDDDHDETTPNTIKRVKIKPQKYKDIKSFICSCKNGKRITSPCIHISATIYYLSWAKIRILKFPAEHLNSIFLKSPDEPANEPK